ncbi:uncharacterized protein LOC118203896 [Stegodyphus dumicola]|uniref:uncharacterized protein LOC118203896 n=1 Tax=Stegodyphus dumicola TaxID=202533 RepID=UPI0015B14CA1|nr:uncharacterized protein LOC118203896 [Stegodyphus dumicola]XP_035232089.1 uncharacterized protein LOC118203896 [Stegodyphus dumicola]
MHRTRRQAVMLDKTNVIFAKANTLCHKVSQTPASNKNDSFQKMNLRQNVRKENSFEKKINKIKCITSNDDKENTKIPLSTNFLKHAKKRKLQNSNKVANNKIDSYFQKKSKDENDINMPQKSIPVWKRLADDNNVPANKQMKKIHERDIYDILQDEQLMTEKAVKKKKVTRIPSKIPLKSKTSKAWVRKEKLSHASKRKCLSSVDNKIINIQSNSENKHTVRSSDARQRECQVQLNKEYTETDHSKEDKSEKEPKNFEIVCNQLEQEIEDVTILKSAPQNARNVANEQCYSSFEKSILPQMTSTPDSKDQHCNNVQPNTKLSEMSSVMCPKSPCMNGKLLHTPESLPHLTVSNTEINDITEDEIVLFQSPAKEEHKLKNEKELRKTGVVINLFPEDPCLSPVKDNLEESVRKPKKAYDTPKQFGKHIIKTKKSGQQKKKTTAQLREEKLIQEMNKHFTEVESFEICVE